MGIAKQKSQRRYARAWVYPFPGIPPICKALAVPKHPARPSKFNTMTSNPAKLAPKDQFLLWLQELEVRQEEQVRQMDELRGQTNRLRDENERLQAQLEASWAVQSREPPRPFPPPRLGKGKEAATPYDIDLPADDELSSSSSPLLRRSSSPNAAKPHSRKRPSRRPSRSINTAIHRTQREPSRGPRPPMPAQQYAPDPTGGLPRPLPSMYPPFGATPAPQMVFTPTVRGPQDMLSTPLGQHILDYDPPRGFSIPPFAMYDGSSDPYDHMLHYNQTMILNVGDDRLLCKVFPTSLKGPSLAWFHKLPKGSINTFNELWFAFVSLYLCSVKQKGNISSLQSILKREDESIRDFTHRFGQAIQQIDMYSMDAFLQNFRRSFGPTTPFFQFLSLDPPITMEELYRRADKFSTLEDNIRAASQTFMITTQNNKPTTKGPFEQKNNQAKSQKCPDGQIKKKKKYPPQFTALNITYDRLLPHIRDLPDFK